MDMSSILPLLMNAKGGNKKNNDSGDEKSDDTSESKKGGLNTADLLSMMNNNGGNLDRNALMQNLIPNMMGGSDNGNIAQIMSLASAMNQNNNGNNNRRNRPPAGIRPIKGIANNDVLGKLVKFFQ